MIYGNYTVVLADMMRDNEMMEGLKLALSDYPLYQGKKLYDMIPSRQELNTRLLNHYKYREIGFETVGRFCDELNITMNEIMPYYNELFKSMEIMADLENPFDNVDIVESFKQTNKGITKDVQKSNSESAENQTSSVTTNSSSKTNGSDKKVHSDTPQDDLSITANSIDNVSYANDVNWNKNTVNNDVRDDKKGVQSGTSRSTGISEGNNETNSTMEYEHRRKGNQGVNTYAHDMNEFRTSIIDVVDMIINDVRISDLFMNIF